MKVVNFSKEQKLLYLLLYIPCFLIGRNLDNDVWFILNSGRYAVQNGIPHIEPFTIHEGMSFVMQQWLSAVIFWVTYKKMGELGLIIIVIAFYMLFTYMTFTLTMFLSEKNFPVSYAISFITIGLINPFMVQRPYIFLFLIILSELYYLENYIRFNRIIYLMPLLFLSVLLINLEAAMWPMLFVILLPYLIDSFKFKFSFIEGQGYGKKWLFLTALVMIAAGLINPYGIKAITYLYNSYGASELNIILEMAPANINSALGKLIFATIFLTFFSFFVYKKGSYKLRYYLLGLGTAYMAISSVRNYSFFIICGIIPLSYFFKDIDIKKFKNKNDRRTLFIRKVLIVLIAVVATFAIFYHNRGNLNTQQQDLVKSVDYLEKLNKSDVKLYTGFNEGGYLEFRGFKVYIDSRADVFLKSNNKKYDIMKEFEELHSGKIYYKDVLNRYNFNYLLIAKDDILYNYLDYDEEYKLIYSSSYYKIYEHINNKK
jgi:hypothetical protein